MPLGLDSVQPNTPQPICLACYRRTISITAKLPPPTETEATCHLCGETTTYGLTTPTPS